MMDPIKLTARRRWGLYLGALGLWLSGAVWLVAHYLLPVQGEFGPHANPLEPWSLRVHGGFAMLALWFVGLLWGVHMIRGWTSRRGRWSGGALIGLLWLLIATGYLLYYLGDEDWRALASLVHWIVGLAALPLFLWHRFAPKRPKPLRRAR